MPAQPANRQNDIQVENLVKKYHTRPVLDHLSMSIESGSFCVLVGANGAGKTTLLRILAGLVRADSGDIRIGSDHNHGNTHHRRLVGYIGHQPMVYQDLTAVENLAHYARLYQVPQAEKGITDALHSVGLGRASHQPVRTYSRGMQQRLAIARALLHDPEILLFDEPYTGLDKEAAHFLDQRLVELHQQAKTIFLAAHQAQRLLAFASHAAWLKDGSIAEHIPVQALPDHLAFHEYLQETS
jgi:heme exporter protein A